MSDVPLTSSWCTNWAGFNTPRLWAMVSEEDNPDSWRQVAAWGQVAGAVKDHRAQLVRAREALTAAWPPETNKSADAFVNELDKLIKGMDTAREDADTTATGLANILEALRQAKDKIQPLYEEYRQKNDDWVPGWWDNAEDEIDQKAQAHMIAAEQIVQQNVPQIRVPEPYVMDPAAKSAYVPDRTDPIDPAGSGGGGSRGAGRVDAVIPMPHDPVPPLPGHQPIVPAQAGGGLDVGAVSSGGIGLAGSAAPAVLPPGPVTVPPVIGGPMPAPSPGPMPGILPGQLPVIGGPIPGGNPRGLVPGGSAGGLVPGGNAGGRVPGGNAGGRGPIGNVGNPGTMPVGAAGGYAGRPVPRLTPGGTRGVLPSGAVIGETVAGRAGSPGTPGRMGGPGVVQGVSGGAGRSGAGSGRAGVPGVSGVSGRVADAGRPGARAATKPTPPSWLPEERGTSGRQAAAAHGAVGAARRTASPESSEGRRSDPDNQWGVAAGVDPVIAPSRANPRHDPGPNVIGYNG
jgi:hypothetical protein